MISKEELDAVEHEVTCPECGSKMELRFSDRFEDRKGGRARRSFYGCSRWPGCPVRHGAHMDGRPLGKPGNQATRDARIKAHAAFDQLWSGKGSRMKRSGAYAWMRDTLGFAHIGEMTEDQCAKLVAALKTRFGIQI